MTRLIALVYGLLSYAFFFVTFLYALCFVENFVVPKTIDSGEASPITEAVIVNLVLMSLFAIQHSVMARRQFKQWWTRFVPKSVERSTYVLFATSALALLCWQWRPMPAVIWRVENPNLADALVGVSLAGWLIVLTSTFLINHFELFGLHQVANNLTGRAMPPVRFKTPLFYQFVRHPIYLGFIIAFWSAPVMTAGHLLFAGVTTAYIIVGILLEERDLVEMFGDDYRRYRQRVSMLLPWRKSARPLDTQTQSGTASMIGSHHAPSARRPRGCVIALHCSLGSGRQWARLADELGGSYRLIAPDISGYGSNRGSVVLPTTLAEEVACLREAHRAGRGAASSGRPFLWRGDRVQNGDGLCLRKPRPQSDLDRAGAADLVGRQRRGRAAAPAVRAIGARAFARSLERPCHGGDRQVHDVLERIGAT